MNNEDIEILLSSDINYKELVVEIFYNGKFIALINQDNGIDNLIIEFPNSNIKEDMISREISLDIFEEALKLAKNRLFT